MPIYSNEAVFEALRRVQYRQVPWVTRPKIFDYLRALGLLGLTRQTTVVPKPGFHAPVDVAVMTERGKLEFTRMSKLERAMDWDVRRFDDYAFGGQTAELAT